VQNVVAGRWPLSRASSAPGVSAQLAQDATGSHRSQTTVQQQPSPGCERAGDPLLNSATPQRSGAGDSFRGPDASTNFWLVLLAQGDSLATGRRVGVTVAFGAAPLAERAIAGERRGDEDGADPALRAATHDPIQKAGIGAQELLVCTRRRRLVGAMLVIAIVAKEASRFGGGDDSGCTEASVRQLGQAAGRLLS
jgi:hypothetical protein